jgi:hypothetical protein
MSVHRIQVEHHSFDMRLEIIVGGLLSRLVGFVSNRLILYWLGLAWLGLAWLGLAWLGLAWLGLAPRLQ